MSDPASGGFPILGIWLFNYASQSSVSNVLDVFELEKKHGSGEKAQSA
jgi:hypothetical protein